MLPVASISFSFSGRRSVLICRGSKISRIDNLFYPHMRSIVNYMHVFHVQKVCFRATYIDFTEEAVDYLVFMMDQYVRSYLLLKAANYVVCQSRHQYPPVILSKTLKKHETQLDYALDKLHQVIKLTNISMHSDFLEEKPSFTT